MKSRVLSASLSLALVLVVGTQAVAFNPVVEFRFDEWADYPTDPGRRVVNHGTSTTIEYGRFWSNNLNDQLDPPQPKYQLSDEDPFNNPFSKSAVLQPRSLDYQRLSDSWHTVKPYPFPPLDYELSGQMTAEAWFYITDYDKGIIPGSDITYDADNWFFKTFGGTVFLLEFGFDGNGEIYQQFAEDDGSGVLVGDQQLSGVTIPLNEWFHAAWIVDTNNGYAQVLIDGQVIQTVTEARPGVPLTNYSWVSGNYHGESQFAESFFGYMDDARISAGVVPVCDLGYTNDFTIPEPATMTLMALGVAGLVRRR
jgi:hypothetical protein